MKKHLSSKIGQETFSSSTGSLLLHAPNTEESLNGAALLTALNLVKEGNAQEQTPFK